MKLSDAQTIVADWSGVLSPSCNRIAVAGSVRREKPEVHDIEIVTAPKLLTDLDMFGNPAGTRSQLDDVISIMEAEGSIMVLKGGSKYKQIALPEGINLDLFIVTPPAQWGVIFLIRTGPSDFSRWIVTARKSGGGLPTIASVSNGSVWVHGEQVNMPEEQDFLNFCGLPWIEPKDRQPRWGRGGQG